MAHWKKRLEAVAAAAAACRTSTSHDVISAPSRAIECAKTRRHAAAQGSARERRSGACVETQDRDTMPFWGQTGQGRSGKEKRELKTSAMNGKTWRMP
jgi:hypothetical protein